MLKLPNQFFGFFKNWFPFFNKWLLWDLANVKRNKVMKFGNSKHQNVKMSDWIWSSGQDLAPLSRNRVSICIKSASKNICTFKAFFSIKISPILLHTVSLVKKKWLTLYGMRITNANFLNEFFLTLFLLRGAKSGPDDQIQSGIFTFWWL